MSEEDLGSLRRPGERIPEYRAALSPLVWVSVSHGLPIPAGLEENSPGSFGAIDLLTFGKLVSFMITWVIRKFACLFFHTDLSVRS